jgi:lysophospholipase L1-like esterase
MFSRQNEPKLMASSNLISLQPELNSRAQMSANSKPFIFILSSFIIVLAVSFLGNTITVLGIQFKNINIISDLFQNKAEESEVIVQDSLIDSDSLKVQADFRTSDEIIGYESDAPLKAFMKALHELSEGKRNKVRIAYFGDSMIEGDLVTQDLRKYLQDYFGGSGVGFVPVTSVVAGFRQSVIHSFSENWVDQNFLNTSASKERELFLSGHAFFPSDHSTIYYSGVRYPHLVNLQDCFALYGRNDSTSNFAVNDSVFMFEGNEVFNKQLVARNADKIHVRFSGSQNHIFGFAFESERGVIVDNLSFRGISGIELQRISPSMLQAIEQQRPYDLIILQYGPNLLFKPELTAFKWYEKPLKNVIERFKDYFPGTSILVIGSADKGCRYDGEYRTQKGVLPLIEVQHRVAMETETNFWSLYNAMGGHNSMIQWVNSNPPLANVDYTHLTHKGAMVLARALYDKLMQVYDPEAASRSQIQPIVRYVTASRGL